MSLFSLIRRHAGTALFTASLLLAGACASDTPANPVLPGEANASDLLQLNLSSSSVVMAQGAVDAPLPEPFVIIASNAAALIPSTGIVVSTPSHPIAQPGGWLEVTPKILGLTASVTLKIKQNSLPEGAYTATFTVKVPGTKNSPKTVTVNYVKGYYFVDGGEEPSWTMTGFWHRSQLTGICNIARPGECLPSPAEGSWALWYGQDATGNFDNGVTNGGTATSALFSIPSGAPNPELRFQSAWETEGDSYFDGMDVELVSEDGLTVHHLGNVYSSTGIQSHMGGYMQFGADLSPYAGGTWRVRFSFNTQDGLFNDYRGWIVDDLRVAEGAAFTGPVTWLTGDGGDDDDCGEGCVDLRMPRAPRNR